MSSWYTRPGGEADASWARPGNLLSPTLLFHKWHAYDREPPILERKDTAVRFLKQVAGATASVLAAGREDARSYAWWLEERYLPALRSQGALFTEAETLWRLVVGFGVNPALESGLCLHHLYGFPTVPGSAVKGLVHHVAEMDLVGRLALGTEPVIEETSPPAEAILEEFVAEAEEIRTLFGSLTVKEAHKEYHQAGATLPPRALLARWQKQVSEPMRLRLRRLLFSHTGGRLVFYDAVPMTREAHLLAPDLLNPHYPQYYRSEGTYPPSDDQSPVPVYFLAVRPGVRFVFPYRLRPAPAVKTATAGRSHEEAEPGADVPALGKLHGWLEQALTSWGAGAKTAAGYGYFQGVHHLAGGKAPAWQEKYPPRDPGRPEESPGAAKAKQATPPAGGKRGTHHTPRAGKDRGTAAADRERGPAPSPASAEPPTSGKSPAERPPGSESRGFTIGDLLASPDSGPEEPKPIAKGDRIPVEVLEHTARGYRLRVLDTGQEDLYYDRPVRWEPEQRLKVRVIRLHPDGRVKEVRP